MTNDKLLITSNILNTGIFKLNFAPRLKNPYLKHIMSEQKYKIGILGVGAVGGFYGAKLASHYASSNEVEITFIARGENAKAIQANGLKLITAGGEVVAHPALVTSNPEEIGTIDILICAVKSYNLETSLEPLRGHINQNTVILPLQNGIDAKERIQKLFPDTEVWEGCVYIVSRLTAPGVIQVTETNNLLHFGSEHGNKNRLEHVHTLLKDAGINVNLSNNIAQKMWEKFLFISPLATITSYADQTVGFIVKNHQLITLFQSLLDELSSISYALNIQLPDDIKAKIITRINSLSPEITTSMHSDFQKHSPTELDTLTGYVVRLGEKLDIPTPTYNEMYTKLLNQ